MKQVFLNKAIAVIVCLFSCMSMCGATRHGLIIGLGEYKDPAWSKIHGDKDVPLIRDMLKKCGYTDLITLTNRQATKSAIVDSFAKLYNKCQQGDIVYIHYSGHGQQITDISGDEEDGWDEAWIPYDAMFAYSGSYKGENHLVDDEIGQWMTRIRQKIGNTGKLLVVVDSCHSGDSLRGEDEEEVFCRGASDDFVIPLKSKPQRTAKSKENWLTLTACRDFQVNCEVKTNKGNHYGMLSFALYKDYKSFKNKGNTEVKASIQEFVEQYRHNLPQDVTLTGTDKDKVAISSFFK